MLQSTSLRLGNLIARAETNEHTGLTTNVPVTVDLEILTAIHNRPNPPYKGIVLTEEWLGKLGFEYDPDYYLYKQVNDYYFVFSKNLGRVTIVKIEDRDLPELDVDHIQFVHQLQNLFYSLTGKELTVNL